MPPGIGYPSPHNQYRAGFPTGPSSGLGQFPSSGPFPSAHQAWRAALLQHVMSGSQQGPWFNAGVRQGFTGHHRNFHQPPPPGIQPPSVLPPGIHPRRGRHGEIIYW